MTRDSSLVSPFRTEPLADGRQSEIAAAIARGTLRVLLAHGFHGLTEVALPNGRRADIMALNDRGEIWIVEIKSSVLDFRSDQKWPAYRDFCDHLFFAVMPDFPREILPADCGLVIADRYGGEIVRPAPEHKLAAARRKAMTLALARIGAARVMSVMDPEIGLEPPPRGV
jgi:hypothetical protein